MRHLALVLAVAVAQPDLDSNIRQRIAKDSRVLGGVASKLLAIQADVHTAQEEVFGKGMDMKSLDALVLEKKAAENGWATCQTQLKQEADQVTVLQQQLLVEKAKVAALEAAAKTQPTSAPAMLQQQVFLQPVQPVVAPQPSALEAPSPRSPPLDHSKLDMPVDGEVQRLQRENLALRQISTALMGQLKSVSAAYTNTTSPKGWPAELKVQYAYSQKCFKEAQTLHKRLEVALLRLQKEGAANEVAAQQNVATSKAATARFGSENTALRTKVSQQGNVISVLKANVTQLQAQLVTLRAESVMSLQKERQSTGKAKQDAQGALNKLALQVNATNAVKAKLDACEEKIRTAKLDEKVAQITQLNSSLTQATASAVACTDGKQQADTALQACMSAKKSAEAMVASTTAMCQKSVIAANDKISKCEAAKAKEKGRVLKYKMKAKAAAQTKCGEEWNKRNAEAKSKLDQCKITAETLSNEQAQSGVLKAALEACNAKR
mmetsp:Transcript_89730/g.240724  ORF Transcript_89730/g.240724 Transcript_89730/m.240724 type:complete len:493 (+) Transcript_89730:126-1604(+)